MKKGFELSQGDFDNLLKWLSPDRDEAGIKYEELRSGLIRFFRFRGCSSPETLADEAINRVALKVSTFTQDEKVKKISIAYGFAFNIYMEYTIRTANREIPLDLELHSPTYEAASDSPEENGTGCLKLCLARLSDDDQKLIISYYQKEKSAKFEWRKKLAQRVNISPTALQTRIHRIKKPLKDCIKKCLDKK